MYICILTLLNCNQFVNKAFKMNKKEMGVRHKMRDIPVRWLDLINLGDIVLLTISHHHRDEVSRALPAVASPHCQLLFGACGTTLTYAV